MAIPKVSLQQRCYQGQWNMRLHPDGEIPMGKPQHQKAQCMTFAQEYTNMECLLQRKLPVTQKKLSIRHKGTMVHNKIHSQDFKILIRAQK